MDFAVNRKYAIHAMRAHHHRQNAIWLRCCPRGDRKYNARQISLLVILLQAGSSPLSKRGSTPQESSEIRPPIFNFAFWKRRKKDYELSLIRYRLFCPRIDRAHVQRGIKNSIEYTGRRWKLSGGGAWTYLMSQPRANNAQDLSRSHGTVGEEDPLCPIHPRL